MIIFPNPTDDFLYIQNKNFSESIVKLNLADLSGRNAYAAEVNIPGGKQMRVDLRYLSSGIYILGCGTNAGTVEYQKIIIK